MAASPSQVLRQYLIDLGSVVDPAAAAVNQDLWPCVTGPVPPDFPNYVGIIDTGAKVQGRIQDSGQRVTHPKVQVVVRAVDYATGYAKGAELQAIFDKIGVPTNRGGNGQFSPVQVGSDDFVLSAAHTLVVLTPVGTEPDTNRQLFTINLQLEITQTTPDNYRDVYFAADPPVDYVLGFQNGYLFRFTPAALLGVMLPPNSQGVLENDGAGNLTWQPGGGGGSVVSVGLALPNVFTVTGSPVTVTGTLTGTLATQAAGTVWAGPASGSAAAPTFRSLTVSDLPDRFDHS